MILSRIEQTPFARLFASLLRVPEKKMNQTERLYRIAQIVEGRGVVSFNDLMGELEVSKATLKRDLATLRDRFNAPIEFDRDAGGYRMGKQKAGPRFELPGLWFSADEILALMTMHQMLDSLDAGGLLGPHIKPLMERLGAALGAEAGSAQEVIRRVKLIPSQQRRVQLKWFELVGRALMTRRRLQIDYFTRYRNERSQREVSPQRLVHYRGNWYLDAWCHKSDGVRMFSLDSIADAVLLDAKAKEVSVTRRPKSDVVQLSERRTAGGLEEVSMKGGPTRGRSQRGSSPGRGMGASPSTGGCSTSAGRQASRSNSSKAVCRRSRPAAPTAVWTP